MKDRACNAAQRSPTQTCCTMHILFDQYWLEACAAASSPPVLAVSPGMQPVDRAPHCRGADLCLASTCRPSL